MRDRRGAGGLGRRRLGVIGEVRPEWCDPHGGPVAVGALPRKQGARRRPPVIPTSEAGDQAVHRRAVAAGGIVPAGELAGEGRLVDASVPLQHHHHGQSHLRVVGVRPRRRRHRARGDQLFDDVRIDEEAVAEGVPDREPLQRP